MKKTLLLIAFVLLSTATMVAQTTIKGTVNDASLGGVLPGANIKVLRKAVGTSTDFDGKFTMKVVDIPPFTIKISSIGYHSKTIEITKNNQVVVVSLTENATSLDEVVISASRTPERVMESPVTIERFDSRAIKNTASASFYDGLENLKGVDINASGLTFKSVNTRGFASFANERFVQLVDGMDNASPALNFALGNLLGMSELDVKTVEILPGAASALYGANAFNGIMLMTSKSPFDDQGISFVYKTGFTSQQAASNNPYHDTSIRMAHAFDNKFAVKATLSYLKGEEWHATDTRNTTGVGGTYLPGDRNSRTDYDGLNVYGDEVGTNIRTASGLGIIPSVRVTRTGYDEVDLMSNEAKSVKFGAALHYRPWGNDRLEIIWNSKYGTGNTIYQGQNRYNISNFFMEQHKLEFKGKNFFIRGYYTGEDAGDSYDTRFTAININREWKSDKNWFSDYIAAYANSVLGNPNIDTSLAHANARKVADTGRLIPGTRAFNTAFNKVTNEPDLTKGSKFQDKTSLYHVDANLNLRDYIDWAEVQVGGSYRQFNLNSFGTIFTDQNSLIDYDEYGLYTQLQKKMMEDRLKLTTSVRYDKAKNFDGNISPRLSLAYAAGEMKNHNLRASFQTGFRNPTTQDQYIGLATGGGTLIGTSEDNLDRFTSSPLPVSIAGQQIPGINSETTYTGRDAFTNAFSESSIIDKTPTKANFDLVKPEKVTSYEIGYRGVVAVSESKVGIDFSMYYNDYKDFIALKKIAVPFYGVAGSSLPSVVPNVSEGDLALLALKNGDFAGVGFRTNSSAAITSYGVGLGLSTKVFKGFNLGVNYTWSKFDFDQSSDPDFQAGFNTPEHKIKIQFGKTNLFKNFGFNVSTRWQNDFYWESSFFEGSVAARTVLDAQVNYKIPFLKSVFKLGGANLTGKEYFSAPGIGAIGSQFFISWTINN
ncbi:TonB-dependent receptor [Tenacibaculum dicentrarchi]|nr:TonB-dependent receptor [Tenacibaculum dicentrarchi]MCD8419267.1 TonB-dependent receptor [Tenacibaculum dicentrarchi]MCD8436398.1 TonB-dependent receptor [Tenacibaculum dicentrarchi]MCD8451075.1 TonB-dependent receptor [Tenacibaculum dicentrarchi]MCG8827180.1 TonB-dependent receptor plug domain-containing protein [Tenacibaculum dicentrarchi]